jgi:PAS domain S-box-containing protein
MMPAAEINQAGRILIVEDEAIVARDLQGRLARMGYEVCEIASSGEKAIEAAGRHKPNIALMDIVLKGDMDGIEAAETIAEQHQIPVVYLTAYADEHTLQRAKLTKPLGYIIKPFSERELSIIVEIALYREAVQRQIRQAEEALRLSEARLRTMIETAADAILIIDERDIIQSCNPATERIFGYATEEIAGRSFGMLTPGAAALCRDGAISAYFEASHAERNGQSHEVEGQRKDGTRILLDLTVAAWSVDGKRYFTGILRDITERKRVEQELILRNTQLARINARLDQFTSIIGHDLRAPLRAIRYFAGWIVEDMESQPGGDIRNHANRILESVKRMSAMLDDLQVYSHAGLDSGGPQPIELKALVEEIRHHVKTDAALSIDVVGPTDKFVAARAAIDIVLRNLIENAVRHSDADHVAVSVHCRDDGEALRFEVADDGPGIPPEYHARVFMPFVKVEPNSNSGGTGIGLALVKQVVEDNGGAIEIVSDPVIKRGTRVCFSWAKR